MDRSRTSPPLHINVPTSPGGVTLNSELDSTGLEYSPSSTILRGMNTKATNSSASTNPTTNALTGVRDSTTRLKSLLSYLDEAETSLLPSSSHRATPSEVLLTDSSSLHASTLNDSESHPPNPPHNLRSSVSADKRWIWDEYNDDGTDSINHSMAASSIAHLQGELGLTSMHPPPSSMSSFTANPEKFKTLNSKIKNMRIELTSKSEDSKTLKASLKRRKVGDERVCKQIEEGWKERLGKRRREFMDMIERQDR